MDGFVFFYRELGPAVVAAVDVVAFDQLYSSWWHRGHLTGQTRQAKPDFLGIFLGVAVLCVAML